MTAPGWALFDTALGRCGLAWNAAGLTGVGLPHASESLLAARLRRHNGAEAQATPPDEHPVAVRQAIAGIQALCNGQRVDLLDVELDWTGASGFHRQVYDLTRAIAPGRTRSYGELAADLGDPGAARAVGQALGANPWPIVVPCHRVLAARGASGGFSAPGGVDTKRRMLAIEQAWGPLFDT